MINNVHYFTYSLRSHLTGEHAEESHGGANKETHRRGLEHLQSWESVDVFHGSWEERNPACQ